jgi:hypothetical protein
MVSIIAQHFSHYSPDAPQKEGLNVTALGRRHADV